MLSYRVKSPWDSACEPQQEGDSAPPKTIRAFPRVLDTIIGRLSRKLKKTNDPAILDVENDPAHERPSRRRIVWQQSAKRALSEKADIIPDQTFFFRCHKLCGQEKKALLWRGSRLEAGWLQNLTAENPEREIKTPAGFSIGRDLSISSC